MCLLSRVRNINCFKSSGTFLDFKDYFYTLLQSSAAGRLMYEESFIAVAILDKCKLFGTIEIGNDALIGAFAWCRFFSFVLPVVCHPNISLFFFYHRGGTEVSCCFLPDKPSCREDSCSLPHFLSAPVFFFFLMRSSLLLFSLSLLSQVVAMYPKVWFL